MKRERLTEWWIERLCWCPGDFKYPRDENGRIIVILSDKYHLQPEPMVCNDCGKWPVYLVRTCGHCSTIFYAWFSHPYYGKQWCWECCENYPIHKNINYNGIKHPPPACVFPPIKTVAELQTIITQLADIELDDFLEGL